ncbi:36310_t:CDS:2, partial [Racocetra persica]
ITRIGTGGFSEIYTATWTKGEITGWSRTKNEYNREENQTIVLKVLKDYQNINLAFLKEAYDAHLMLDICNENFPLRPNITEDTPQCWAILMQKCWHPDPLERPAIDKISGEKSLSSSFLKLSELLNPTIDSALLDLFQGSRSFTLRSIISFQNIKSDSFNIIPKHFKNANGLNSTINLSTSKRRITELLLNKNDY